MRNHHDKISNHLAIIKYSPTKIVRHENKLLNSLLYTTDHSCMGRLWKKKSEKSAQIITNNLFIHHSQLSSMPFYSPILQFQSQQRFGTVSTLYVRADHHCHCHGENDL